MNFFYSSIEMQANSVTCHIRPNGIVDGRGVIPDMIVVTTIDDMIAGNHTVLDYTLKMIRDGQ